MSRWAAVVAVGGAAVAVAACSSQPSAGPGATATPIPTISPVTPPVAGQAADAAAGGSSGDSTSTLDTVSNGTTPVALTVTVSAPDCSQPVDAHLTVSLTRGSAALPGGIDVALTHCGTFPEDVRPPAGPVHVIAHARSAGNALVSVSLSANGSSSHTITSNNAGNYVGNGVIIP